MELDITEGGDFRLKKVFNPVVFETDEGERMSVCMRDGGFELSVKDTSVKGADIDIVTHFSVKDGQMIQICNIGTEAY